MLFSLYLGMDSKLDFVPFTECIRNVDEKRGVMVQIYGHGAHLSRRNKPRLPKTRLPSDRMYTDNINIVLKCIFHFGYGHLVLYLFPHHDSKCHSIILIWFDLTIHLQCCLLTFLQAAEESSFKKWDCM